MIHLINGRSRDHARTFGNGTTWCGKKLVGDVPIIPPGDGTTTITSYGTELRITDDPALSDCPHCKREFEAAYAAAFPEGLKPIATIRFDDPQAGEKMAELMTRLSGQPVMIPAGEELLEDLRAFRTERLT